MKNKSLFLLSIIFVLSILFFSFTNNPKKIKYNNYKEYIVQPGDTLWTIAQNYPHKDIESLIYDIEQASDTSALIKVGQVLRIPIDNK
jgi:LysM repeat protein